MKSQPFIVTLRRTAAAALGTGSTAVAEVKRLRESSAAPET